MNFKMSVLLITAFLLISLGGQVVVAGSGNSAEANISVTVIELTQNLYYDSTIVFEPNEAEWTNEDGKFGKVIEDAGNLQIDTNIPWKLYANASVSENVKVFLRISNDGEREWTPVSNEPILSSRAPGKFNFTWDIMVVADSYAELESFKINFELNNN